jgi:long-chain acyl-CoA synthetase
LNIARTLLDGSAAGEDILLQFEERNFTFAEIDNGIFGTIPAINQLAKSATKIAVFMQTSPEAIQALYAVWALGKITVVFSPLLGTEELKVLLEKNKPELLLVDNETEEKIKAISDHVDAPVYNVSRGEIRPSEKGSAVDLVVDCKEEDSAIILFTSGSTGMPKGVTLTHGSVYGSIDGVLKRIRGDRPRRPKTPGMKRKVSILPKPIFHISGLWNTIFTFEVGRIVNLMRKFDVEKFTKFVEETQTDSISLNPTMLKMVLDQKEIALPRLKSVKYVRSGTMPLPDSIRDEFEKVFGIYVLQGYGQTEAGGEVIGWSADDLKYADNKRASIGRTHPNVELAVMDPNGTKLNTDEIGEICVRGKHFMKAYSSSDHDSPYDDEGFLHTGDLGYVDEDGFVFLTGRLRNIIIAGGFNIYPEEVENILLKFPGVKDLAVAPLADDRLGEVPIALIQQEPNHSFDPNEFIQFAREHLAHYKVPRKVFLVDELPKTGYHKLDRPKLREIVEHLAIQDVRN